MPRLHPNLAELYRQKVMNLAEALNDEDTRLEAAECTRELFEEIRLVPENGKLRVELYGELATLINLAIGHPRSKTGVQITLVAGTCNHRELRIAARTNLSWYLRTRLRCSWSGLVLPVVCGRLRSEIRNTKHSRELH